MKIAFDVQPAMDREKTGVGYVAASYVKRVAANYPDNDYQYNYFHTPCGRMLYRLFSVVLPLPYCLFFPGKPDVTHFFNFVIPPFVRGKKIVMIHDMAVYRFPETVRGRTKRMLRLSLRQTLKRADCVITVSEFSKQEILSFFDYPEKKIKVVYNGADLETYRADIAPESIRRVREAYELPEEYILYLGTLEPRKNIERLIEAYGLARQRRKLPRLVIAGRKGWMYEGIFAKYRELAIGGGVIFPGYVADADKPPLLAGAMFFVFPSLYEGFGLPPLEAMACGTPVIAGDTAALPEICGDAAVYVDPFDIDAIAGALARLASDEALRGRMRGKGLERARLFRWDKSAARLFEIYEEVAKS
jgi:glycosyltransferase involved in cell wall biosynthesis